MNLKERLIDYLNVNDFSDDKDLLLRLQNYMDKEIQYNNTLLNYGINNLKEYFEDCILENKDITNTYDLTDELFDDVRRYGSVISFAEAEQEILANYSLSEIDEIVADEGWNLGDLNSTQIHTIICEKEFAEYFEEKVEEIQNEYPELDDRASLIKTCLEISKEHDLGLEKINNKEINALEKKKSFRIKDDDDFER